MKKRFHLLSGDLKRALFQWKTLGCILLIAGIYFISDVELLQILKDNPALLQNFDVVGVYNYVLQIDRFKTLLYIVIAAVYTDAFCREYNTRSAFYLIARSGSTNYVLSKIITIVLSGIFVYASGTAIYLGVLRTMMPWATEQDNPMYDENIFMAMEAMDPRRYPAAYLILTMLLVSLSLVSLCVAAFFVSLSVHTPLVIICMPAVVFFMLATVTQFGTTGLYFPSYGNQNVLSESGSLSWWATWLIKAVFHLAIIFLFSVLSAVQIKEKIHEGNLY